MVLKGVYGVIYGVKGGSFAVSKGVHLQYQSGFIYSIKRSAFTLLKGFINGIKVVSFMVSKGVHLRS